ncbi:MAG: hypothetical protein AAFR14_03070 [Bacteroidota bacterium]
MSRRLLTLLLSLSLAIHIVDAQSTEVREMLLEGQELYDQGRYDEAVRMCNRILDIDPSFGPAILLSGQTKYELGAFKGTKMDAIKHIEAVGITKELIQMMIKTEHKLDNLIAAENYASVGLEMDPYDPEIHYLAGEIDFDRGEKGDACRHYAQAALLGYAKANREVRRICGGISDWIDTTPREEEVLSSSQTSTPSPTSVPQTPDPQNKPADPAPRAVDDEATDPFDMIEDEPGSTEAVEQDASETSKDPSGDNDEQTGEVEPTDINLGTDPDEVSTSPAPPEPVVEEDLEASQDYTIDEGLVVSITNGLGNRKLDYKPAIFMLSDRDGLVVIDICVSANGRVTDAEFNRDQSTIFRSSLTSLALRKAKQFTFKAEPGADQCGTLIYRIKV